MKTLKTFSLLKKVLFLVISMSFTVAMAQDKSTECIPAASLDYALSKFKFEDLDVNGNSTKVYSQQDACDKGLLKKAIGAIDYLRQLPQATMQTNFQTVVSKEGSLNFLLKRVHTIQFESLQSEQCTETTGAFVNHDEGGVMHICQIAHKLSPLVFAQVLIHEARHVDGFKHVACKQGYNQDIEFDACDETYQEQGSYGIGVGFLFQVYFGTKNEAVKQQARSEAIQNVLNNFNKSPLGLVNGGLFLDTDDTVSFFDGKTETQLGSFTNPIATISFIDNVPYIFFKNGDITRYDFTREWALREGTLKDSYNKLSQQERNELLDILTNSSEYCFLSPSRVQCSAEGENRFREFNFSQIVPMKFVSKNTYYASDIIVLGADRKSYQLPTSADFAKFKESDLRVRQSAHRYPEVTSYAEMENGTVVGVSSDGFMLEKAKDSQKWTRSKAFGDYKFKKIMPYKWSKKLEDL